MKRATSHTSRGRLRSWSSMAIWALVIAVSVMTAAPVPSARAGAPEGGDGIAVNLVDFLHPLWGSNNSQNPPGWPWPEVEIGPEPRTRPPLPGEVPPDEKPRTLSVCGCMVTALANILNYTFAAQGLDPNWPAPHFIDRTGVPWSPLYTDAWVRATDGYKDLGSTCGVLPYPYALSEAATRTIFTADSFSMPLPHGLDLHTYKTAGLGSNTWLISIIKAQLDSRKLVLAGTWNATTGLGHIYMITGYLDDGRFLAVGMTGGGSTHVPDPYDKWMGDISQVWTYSLDSDPPGDRRTWFGVEDDPGKIDVSGVAPDGARTGVDPATGNSYDEDPRGYYWSVPSQTSIVSPVPGTSPPDAVGVFYHSNLPGQYRFTVRNEGDEPAALSASHRLSTGATEQLPAGDLHVDPHTTAKYVESLTASGEVTVREVSDFEPQAVLSVAGGATDREPAGFDGRKSFDVDGAITSYSWAFGDGQQAEGAVAQHQYRTPGRYTAELTVTDEHGNVGKAERLVVVGPYETDPPVTAATTDPSVNPPSGAGWAPDDVTVHLSASDTGGSGVSSITWWSDGAQKEDRTTTSRDAVDITVQAEGVTKVYYFATDNEGNAEEARAVDVGVDRTAPEVHVRVPAAGDTIASIPFIGGGAQDAASGPGASEVLLRRNADGSYWNGTAWVTAPAWLAAGQGRDWWRGNGLPAGVDLAAGSYSTSARTTDRAGNRSIASAPVTFTVVPTHAAPSTIRALPEGSGVFPEPDTERPRAVKPGALIVGAGTNSALPTSDVARRGVTWDGAGPISVLAPDPTFNGAPANTFKGSSANDATATGSVVGASWWTGTTRATVWNASVPSLLPPLPGNFGTVFSDALAAGPDGQVVGWATSSFSGHSAVVWPPGSSAPQRIPDLGGTFSEARAINSSGVVVGGSWLPGAQSSTDHAFRTTPGSPAMDLGTLGGDRSIAYDINDHGLVAGLANAVQGGPPHAVLWDGTRITDLGPGVATSVNEGGTVAGYRDAGGGSWVPVVWKEGRSSDLSDLAPVGSGWGFARTSSSIFGGEDINAINEPVLLTEDGSVVGTGSHDGGTHGYVLSSTELGGTGGTTDTTPPTTAVEHNPVPNGDGWNNTPVTLQFAAQDDPGGSGMSGIRTTAEGGSWTAADHAEVRVADEGTTTVGYASQDRAGNTEPLQTTTVHIDSVAPALTIDGVPAGWASKTVTVRARANDKQGSGGRDITVADQETGETTTTAGEARELILAAGVHHLTAWATDRADNSSAHQDVVVRVDLRAPDIAALASRLPVGDPLTVSATDDLSGVQALTVEDLASDGTARPLVPGQPLRQVGTHVVRVTATDNAGNTDTATFTIDVTGPQDSTRVPVPGNHAPVADAGGPVYRAKRGTPVTLDGTRSSDQDGDQLTYQWSLGDGTRTSGATPTHAYDRVGQFVVSLVVDDGKAESDETSGASSSFAIVDVTESDSPPDCSAAQAVPQALWPPNHNLVDVAVAGIVDHDGGPLRIAVTRITQDEPVQGTGDGNTAPDAVVGPESRIRLRAEREGQADGRIYRIAFTATDGRGLSCNGAVAVSVPHDVKDQARDSGQTYLSLPMGLHR